MIDTSTTPTEGLIMQGIAVKSKSGRTLRIGVQVDANRDGSTYGYVYSSGIPIGMIVTRVDGAILYRTRSPRGDWTDGIPADDVNAAIQAIRAIF